MSQFPSLTLVSDVDPPTAFASQVPHALSRLAGRGSVQFAWDRARAESSLRPWQRGLLHALHLNPDLYASAPVTARGSGFREPEALWLHAEPVHFLAGLDRLSFVDLRHAAPVTSTERAALFDTLHAQFAMGDLTLHALGDAWFIRAPAGLRVQTSPPDAASANELQSVMPRGADAPAIRRLMTEMQMLLHDHPVNEARSRRGVPVVNAIWPWGEGALTSMASAGELPVAFAHDAFIQGLYQLNEQIARPLPQTAEQVLSSTDAAKSIVVAPIDIDPDELESKWIAPLAGALEGGRLSRLDLILGEWSVAVPRSSLRRFWRRALAPAQWERAS